MGKITSCWTLSNRLHDLAVTYDFAGPVFPHRQNTPLQRTTTDPLSPVGGRRTWSSTAQLILGFAPSPFLKNRGRCRESASSDVVQTNCATNYFRFAWCCSEPMFADSLSKRTKLAKLAPVILSPKETEAFGICRSRDRALVRKQVQITPF